MIMFPPNTQILMKINNFVFHKTVLSSCRRVMKALRYYIKSTKTEYLEKQRIISSIEYLSVSDCFPHAYLQVRIRWLPCKLPCQYLDLENNCEVGNAPEILWHESNNIICDICENTYTLCDSVKLKHNISISIGIKPNLCLSVDQFIGGILNRSPAMMLVPNENNMISIIPNFTGWIETSVCSYKCIMEIPKAAMYTDHSFAKQRVTLHMVKTAYWDGVLYYH